MALGKTLNELVEAVRAECKLSSNTSRGIDHRDHLVQLVRRHYNALAEGYEWEHLRLKKTDDANSRVDLAAGQRQYNFPANVNVQKIERAWVLHGGVWHPLDYGIDFDNYTALDPEQDQRTDPPTHWEFYGADQFEVWPLPSSDHAVAAPYQVGFDGMRAHTQLVSNSDRADIDDILITLAVAAEHYAGIEKKAMAEMKLGAFNDRLNIVRGGLSSKRRIRVGLGHTGNATRQPRRIDYVRPR